jgi:hypothetical protein
MDEHTRFGSRIAHCRERDADDYEQVVHGVAHGADELTRGQNGLKYWPAAELKKAAPTLEGRTVYEVHGDGDREAVGAVLRAAYQDGLGVVYEAGIDDPDVAEELASGQREVSIEAGNPGAVDEHGETGAVIMRDYEYTGLATPERGASDANYTAPGSADGNPAVAALSATDLEGVLDGDDVEIEDTDAELNAYRTAGGVRYRGTRDGKLDRSKIPNDDYEDHFLFDRDTKSASSYPVVDADGYLRRGNVAAAYSLGPRGGVSRDELYEKLRPLNAAFSTPPVEPEKLALDMEATMAALADDLSASVLLGAERAMLADGADDLTGARTSGRDADAGADVDADADADADSTEDTMSDDNNENDNNPSVAALLERVDEKDEEIDSLEADLEATEAELEEKDERIAELEDDVEGLREQNQAARERFAAALAEADTVFDEDELAEQFTLAELSEKVDNADFGDDGDTSPVIRSGGGSEAEANLSDGQRERKQEIEARLSELEGKEGALAEKEAERLEDELDDLDGGDN